jgi:hypothetical protein
VKIADKCLQIALRLPYMSFWPKSGTHWLYRQRYNPKNQQYPLPYTHSAKKTMVYQFISSCSRGVTDASRILCRNYSCAHLARVAVIRSSHSTRRNDRLYANGAVWNLVFPADSLDSRRSKLRGLRTSTGKHLAPTTDRYSAGNTTTWT